MSASLAKPKISVGMVAELTAGGETAVLQLEQVQENGTEVLRGGMLAGQRLFLGALLSEALDLEPLDSMANLAITELSLEIRPTLDSYTYQLGIANAWSVELAVGDGQQAIPFSVDRLFVALRQSPNERAIYFLGEFTLFNASFSLAISRIVQGRSGRGGGKWTLTARAENIELAVLVNRILGDGQLTDELGVSEILINSLELELEQEKKASGKPLSRYSFRGDVRWDIDIPDTSVDPDIAVSLDFTYIETERPGSRTRTKTIEGTVAGSLSMFEDAVKIDARYRFSNSAARNTNQVGFGITVGDVGIEGTYANDVITLRPAAGSRLSVGDIINYVASLFDPSFENFELDPPWDALGKQSIDLDQLSIAINLTTKAFTFAYTPEFEVVPGLFSVSNVRISYKRVRGKFRPQIGLRLSTFGQESNPEWDPVNENPPAIPGKGVQIFDLQFLAIGQRVTFHPEIVSQARTISQVMTVLRQTMGVLPPAQRRQNPFEALQARLPKPSPVSIDPTAPIDIGDASPIRFDPNSGILLGAQFSVMDTLDMSVIFNDPLIYGLRISLYGAKAKLFDGLQFEILYRRVSDTVGVYHIELALPQAMRQFDVGALAITLPVVVVDIYTNGDFALDFGFPWKGDFSRSFAIQGFVGPVPVLGAGGFYFAKLSAETATSTPQVSNGSFDPVYEFGLGLKIGIGRTFNKGVLQAEISITVRGVIQGVVARFNPTEAGVATDDYFKIQGGVSLVGRLYGLVDFGVISVDVEVLIRATILFVVEAYKAIELALEAEVSVRASVKVLFVRVRFSFNVTVRQSFTIGSDKTPPWRLEPSATVALEPLVVRDFQPRSAQAFEPQAAQAFEPQAAQIFEVQALAAETTQSLEISASPGERFASSPSSAAGTAVSAAGPTAASDRSGRWPAGSQVLVEPLSTDQRYFYDLASTELTNTELAALRDTMDVAKVAIPATDSSPATAFYQVRIVDYSGQMVADQRLDALPELAADIDAALANADRDRTADSALVSRIANRIGQSPTPRLRIDLYFQPGFTKVDSNVKGVALLFIENSIRSDDPNQVAQSAAATNSDFDELMKLLLRWTLASYGQTASRPLTLADWQRVYEDFTAEFATAAPIPAFYHRLLQFLANNVVFEISTQPRSGTSDLSGSFFPIIADLTLQVGDTTAQDFRSSTFQTDLDAQVSAGATTRLAQLETIKAYLKQLRVSQGTVAQETSGSPSGGITATSSTAGNGIAITEFLFADYFLLLIRSGLQNAIDYRSDQPDGTSLTGNAVLDALNQNGAFNHCASAASRYFLHGVRLPLPTDAPEDSWDTTALYEITGQQFPATAALSEIALAGSLPWVKFDRYEANRRASRLIFDIQAASLTNELTLPAFITQLGQASLNLAAHQPQLMSFYETAPRQYTLRHRIATVKGELRELPADLRAYAQERGTASFRLDVRQFSLRGDLAETVTALDNRREVSDFLRQAFERQGLALERPTVAVEILRLRWRIDDGDRRYLLRKEAGQLNVYRQNVAAHWATKVKLTLNLIDANSAVYELAGTDEAGKDFLEAIRLEAGVPSLTLCYPDGGRLTPVGSSVTRLLKTNLATGSASDPSATLSDGRDFLRLLWEASTIDSGGYYLECPTEAGESLPADLFTDGQRAELTLEIQVADRTDQAHPFHNCVVLQQAFTNSDITATRVESSLAAAAIADPVYVLQMPVGHLGIELTRPAITVDDQDGSAADELANLYQLLGYRLKQSDAFRATPEGMPVGPQNAEGRWKYDRVIPAYTLATEAGAGGGFAPSQELDPYRGIRPEAALSPQLEWRDIYGNRHTDFTGPALSVRYTDPLLGLNQWPSLVERYRFANGQLTVSLQLDLEQFIATADGSEFDDVKRRTRAARETYQQIFYQLHQADVTAAVETSVLTNSATALNIGDLRTFVAQAYRQVATLESLQQDSFRLTLVPSSRLATTGPAPANLGAVVRHLNGETPESSAQRPLTAAAVVRVNQTVTGLIAAGQDLVPLLLEIVGAGQEPLRSQITSALATVNLTTAATDTFHDLLNRFEQVRQALAAALAERPPTGNALLDTQVQLLRDRLSRRISLEEIAIAAQAAPSSAPTLGLNPNVPIIRPPSLYELETSLGLGDAPSYPDKTIFPVTVQITLERDTDLVHQQLTEANVPADVQTELAAAVQQATAYLAPEASAEDSRSVELRQFAVGFEETFAGLRLASSDNRNPSFPGDPNNPSSQSLWAVRLGKQDITYGSKPRFFAPAPLANTLMGGDVDLKIVSDSERRRSSHKPANKRFDAIDLNQLGQNFLQAVEDFLKPEVAMALTGASATATHVETVIAAKETLSQAISDQVTNILQTPSSGQGSRRQQAAAALRRELRVNLARAYAIETIVQYEATVANRLDSFRVAAAGAVITALDRKQFPASLEQSFTEAGCPLAAATSTVEVHTAGRRWTIVDIDTRYEIQKQDSQLRVFAPLRLAVQPVLTAASLASDPDRKFDLENLDFTLSPARLSLESASHLTFFFDTPNPEKYEDLELTLALKANELEYNIKNLPGVKGYQASDWLSLILADSDGDILEPAQIPIPLRTYPVPPSLVFQRAELDPDSRGDSLANVRQWQYLYTYEHLDVAQDTLESDVQYNLSAPPPLPNQLGSVDDSSAETLFDALVRFDHHYPALAKVLADLPADLASNREVTESVASFASLVKEVAARWSSWQLVTGRIDPQGVDYEINEKELTDGPATKEVTIVAPTSVATLPQVQLPQFRELPNSPEPFPAPAGFYGQRYLFADKTRAEAKRDPVFGESSIPDRTLIIQDRDIIAHQSAWSGIWLARNRQLMADPTVRTNPAFVFQTPQVRFSNPVTPLLVNSRPWNIAELHPDGRYQALERHLDRLFATVLPARAALPYGLRLDCRYSFAVAAVAGETLFSAVPVLLTPRLEIKIDEKVSGAMVGAIATEIERWRRANAPVEDEGRYQFALQLFSGIGKNTTLPMLKIERLFVLQADVDWDL